MATMLSTTELRNMQTDDLRRDERMQRSVVAKLLLGIKLQKEKDTAKYKREKKLLARILTVLHEKVPMVPRGPKGPTSVPPITKPKPLKKRSKSAKIPIPSSAQPSSRLRPAGKATAGKP